jgi:integrase
MGARRQQGSLRKRKSGGVTVWLGMWWDNGHRRAKTLGLIAKMTKTEAQSELAKHVQPINEKSGVAEYTLKNFTETIFYPFYRRGWKASTARTTPERINHHIITKLGEKLLSWFTRDRLQDFLDEKAKSGISQAVIAHLRWDLRQLFRMALNEELLSRNPAELLHIPKGKTRERRVLTLQQTQQAINALQLRERLIVKLAVLCGMRPGEIVGLQWNDVKEQTITIQRRIYRGSVDTPKTRNSYRTIALPNSVMSDINEWREQRNNDATDWLFPSEKNTPLWANTVFYDYIRPAWEPLGLGWANYQVMRRTAVTLLNQTANADPTIIASMLGHTVDVSLNTYNQVGIARQRQAVQKLDNIINAA